MDAFKTHETIIGNYRNYLKSFVNIADERIRENVEAAFDEDGFLPEPKLQFNPSYQSGETLENLATEGKVHPELASVFGAFRLHKHQVEALKVGVEDKGFVVTSGTGSGKSLTFLGVIFNSVFKAGSARQKGVKAILVYPMNALLNSQDEEIEKHAEAYERTTGKKFPITWAKYSGQEGGEAREKTKSEEPDIILTNYMMLELIMTRSSESWMRKSMKNNLKYLVFDELHTYKGRQGSDVSILIRRIRNHCKNELVCIGTSATMASEGSPEEKKQAVANVAQTVFGTTYHIDQIISEHLKTCTNGLLPNAYQLSEAAKKGIDNAGSEEDFINHPLANWLEINVALSNNKGLFERGKPITIREIAQKLKSETELPLETANEVITGLLVWAEALNEKNREKRRSFLPFKIHQFISQTGNVSVTLEPRNSRKMAIKSGRYIKEDGTEKTLFPLLFSRYSGAEFICVEKDVEKNTLLPRAPEAEMEIYTQKQLKELGYSEENLRFGYLLLDEGEDYWNADWAEIAPEAWLKPNRNLTEYYGWHMPQLIYFNSEGKYSTNQEYPIRGYYIPANLRIDPTAGIFYEDAKTNERTKLASLGHEGRSTATTVISYSVVKSLLDQNENLADQKLLSFTDNRQDAALQAGHFNDFIAAIRLRAAIYQALLKNTEPITTSNIAELVFNELKLDEKDYVKDDYVSRDPDFPETENRKAIKQYLLIRIFDDLKKGWRYTLPNLEQTAQLEIDYERIDLLCSKDEKYKNLALVSVPIIRSIQN